MQLITQTPSSQVPAQPGAQVGGGIAASGGEPVDPSGVFASPAVALASMSAPPSVSDPAGTA
jgi:hypothetical protein